MSAVLLMHVLQAGSMSFGVLGALWVDQDGIRLARLAYRKISRH